jgi:hypothetical protein
VRISVLWIFMAVAFSAESALFLMGPGAVEEIEAMAMGPEMLFYVPFLARSIGDGASICYIEGRSEP